MNPPPPEGVLLDLESLAPPDLYRALSNVVVPRPIAFVSTLDPEGRANLAPYSFFMLGGSAPPSLCVSPTLGRGGEKDTLRNVRATGEFVVSLVTRAEADGMNATSAPLPAGESEWPAGGFTKVASSLVRPPRPAECPVSFECRLHAIVEHGDGIGSARYVVGEIVAVWMRADLVGNTGDFAPIARLGGPDYLDLATGERFALERPQ